jgi:hypothetical protein
LAYSFDFGAVFADAREVFVLRVEAGAEKKSGRFGAAAEQTCFHKHVEGGNRRVSEAHHGDVTARSFTAAI